MPPQSSAQNLGFPHLGVVIVTFNSADVILDCLESLLASTGVALQIAVVDNASQDDTLAVIRDWAAGRVPFAMATDLPLTLPTAIKPLDLKGGANAGLVNAGLAHRLHLIETGINGGFAAGVNHGLAHLATLRLEDGLGDASLDRFWILNPDSVADPEAAHAFATAPDGFGLMGGRVLYLDHPDTIQIDGGTLNARTGITGNLNLFARTASTPPPAVADMAFITGASMVVSRAFYNHAGPMPEEYFLYYEEVDWAMRRGALTLAYAPTAVVYHRAGTAIGSAAIGRPASPFALYFKHRGRLHFMRRYFPAALPMAYVYSFAKAAQLLIKGYPVEARTLLGASLGLPPSATIHARLSPEAARLAFAPLKR